MSRSDTNKRGQRYLLEKNAMTFWTTQ